MKSAHTKLSASTVGGCLALLVLLAPVVAESAPAAQSPAVTAKPNSTYTYSSVKDGVGRSGIWRDANHSIRQSDASGRAAFPLFVFKSPTFGAMEYTGEFFIESGNEDRYAGFVLRLRDANNYYAVRFSASENNIFFARFDNGVRTVLASYDAAIKSRHWEKMRLVARKDAITIFLNGKSIGTVKDSKWTTGKVGLGTKADSITRFRSIRISTGPSS